MVLRVDPDDAAVAVEQRPAGVAVVDRGVRLDGARDHVVLRRLDVAPGGAHNPGGHRALEPGRVSDGVDASPTRTLPELANVSGWSVAAGALTRTTAMSVVGSAPTTLAGYVPPPLNPTRMSCAPCTTWSFVTMSPLRSTTKPEPSAPTCSVPPGVKKVGGTIWVTVSSISTTAGASAR